MARALPLLVLFLALLGAPRPAAAQQSSRTATLNVAIGGLAKISLSAPTISFPDADPDTVPKVPASGGPVTITAKARSTPGGAITLTVDATDDLRSGTSVIPASAISWTATGNGFVAGMLAVGSPQTVATWAGPGQHTGAQTFYLANAWTYTPGTYSLTLTYTLIAP